MSLTIAPRARALPFGRLGRVIVVVLAAVALLGAVLAMHSAAPSGGAMAPAGSPVAPMVSSADPSGAQGMTGGSGSMECHAGGFGPVCAAMAAACLVVVIAVALALLAAFPATYYRLLEQGRSLRMIAASVRPAPLRPSLVLLSISRT